MWPLITYMLRSYSSSQRYFAPVAGTIIAVLVLYSYRPNPVMNSYAATAVILFVGCAWMGLSFLNHEQAVQRQVTVIHLRSAVKYNCGLVATLVFLTLLLDLLTVFFPVLAGRFNEPVGLNRFSLALTGHALLGMLGISISLYLQSSWISKNSFAVGTMLIILILSIGGSKLEAVLPGPVVPVLLPPVSPVMDALMNADGLPVAEVLGSFVHALIYIAVLIGFYMFRSCRMDYNKSL